MKALPEGLSKGSSLQKFFSGDMKPVRTVGEKLVTGLGVAGLGGAVLRQMSNEGQKLGTEVLDTKQLDARMFVATHIKTAYIMNMRLFSSTV